MNPYYADDAVTLYAGDCLEVLTTLPDNSVDAVVTDPPYGLEFMGKEWDKFKPHDARIRTRTDQRTNGAEKSVVSTPESYRAGLPFQRWCQLWAAECLRVLKPGGHLLAFGGTRTWHRLAVAIEDAGFEIRDSIAWLYGSGFPKSLDVSKAIDKRPGVTEHAAFAAHLTERREAANLSRADVSEKVVGTRSGACWNWEHHQFPEAKWWPALRSLLDLDGGRWDAVIAEAERVITQKATRAAVAGDTITFDQRSSTERERRDISATADAQRWQGFGTSLKPAHEPIVVARRPLVGTVAANVLAHGTGALNIDGCRIAGEVPTTTRGANQFGSINDDGWMPSQTGQRISPHFAGRWPANVALDEAAAAALDHMSGEQRDGVAVRHNGVSESNLYGAGMGALPVGTNDLGYGAGGGASRFFYTAKAGSDERITHDGIAHPTVKPLSLMRWLVRLVCPPGGVILEPFAGSGTTVEAAILEGFRCIAIERETDYLPLITQRLNRRRNPVAYLTAAGEDLGLFDEEPA